MPAGIPLDSREIRYEDQERSDGGFEDFQSIDIEFESENGRWTSLSRFPDHLYSYLQKLVFNADVLH